MENLETIKLSKQQELARYRQRPDAKPYVIKKLTEQIAALDRCVDLADSRVDNQLLILLRNTIYKAMHVEEPDDVLIIGMRLTNNPEIRRIGLADLIYSTKIDDPQKGLYELLEIQQCDQRGIAARDKTHTPCVRYAFDFILEGLDNFKV